jgi:hypothetical protein
LFFHPRRKTMAGETGSDDSSGIEGVSRQADQVSKEELEISLLRADLALRRDQSRLVRKQTELLESEIKLKLMEVSQAEALREVLQLAKETQALFHARQALDKLRPKTKKGAWPPEKRGPKGHTEDRAAPEETPFNPPRNTSAKK